jgi:putative phosphoribosyl transferase
MNEFVEDRALRDRRYVFEDRRGAGKLLAGKLTQYKGTGALILAIPSGGLPVAAETAKALNMQSDIIIVRKLQIPFNPEAGFGAMGPDGEVIINEELLSQLMLTEEAVKAQVKKTREVIRKRNHLFREGRPFPSCKDRSVIVVDDGLASGYTMLAALEYIKKRMPSRLIAAVPTGPERTIRKILTETDEVICLNVRSDFSFAVADAYRNWYDLTDEDVLTILKDQQHRLPSSP